MNPVPDPELDRIERLRQEGTLTAEDCELIRREIRQRRAAEAAAAARPPEIHYGGFLSRFVAQLIDTAVYLTWFIPQFSYDSQHRLLSLWLLPANFLFLLGYNVALVRWRGGTLGKLLTGLRVCRADLAPLGWREALLRETPSQLLWLILTLGSGWPFWNLTDAAYAALQHLPPAEFHRRVIALLPFWYGAAQLLSFLWGWSELAVLFTNVRRRGLQDFLAGTVVLNIHPPGRQ